MSHPSQPNIPRLQIPSHYEIDRSTYRGYNAFGSPKDGPIVQILDDLWQAVSPQGWMWADGERIMLRDFQAAALDPTTYPEYDGRTDAIDLRLNMAGTAFSAVLNPIINEGLAIGEALMRRDPEAYKANVYQAYASWAKSSVMRDQYLVSTQRAVDMYETLRSDPKKRHLKFLRTFDVLFDGEPPDDEPRGPDERDLDFIEIEFEQN